MTAGEASAKVVARLFGLTPEDGLVPGRPWSLVHCAHEVPADLSMSNLLVPVVESFANAS